MTKLKKPRERLFYFNYLLYLRSEFITIMGQDCFDIDYEGTLLLKSTVIDGNLKSEKDICLKGIIRGNVHSAGRVIIGKDALIDGDVDCRELFLKGEITGNVCVACKTVMGEEAVIDGALVTESLQIFPGAKIANGLRLRKLSK